MQKKQSFIGKFFAMLAEIIAGIREAILAAIFGRRALAVPEPSDNAKVMEPIVTQSKKITEKQAREVKIKKRETVKDKAIVKMREPSKLTSDKNNLEIIDDSSYTRIPDFQPEVIPPAIENNGQTIGCSLSVQNMSLDQVCKMISDDVINLMHGNASAGAIEFGGRVIDYFMQNESPIGKEKDGTFIRDIMVTDRETQTPICSITFTHFINSNGDYENSYEKGEFYLRDLSLFRQEQEKNAHNVKENVVNSDAELPGHITVVEDVDLDDEQHEIDEAELKDYAPSLPLTDERHIAPQPPKTYIDFIETVRLACGADKAVLRDDGIHVFVNPYVINEEKNQKSTEEYLYSKNGHLYEVKSDGQQYNGIIEGQSAENCKVLCDFVRQNFEAITHTTEYKVYSVLSKDHPKTGNIGDIHYDSGNNSVQLTNARNGQEIGCYKKDVIDLIQGASSIEEAMMITDCAQKMNIQELANIAQSGDVERFNMAVSEYTPAEKEALREELELRELSASTGGIRQSLGMAMGALNASDPIYLACHGEIDMLRDFLATAASEAVEAVMHDLTERYNSEMCRPDIKENISETFRIMEELQEPRQEDVLT